MSGSSKVIVVHPDGPAGGDGLDARAGRQIQLGFEREGVPVALAAQPDSLPLEDAGLVLIGGTDGQAIELLREARSQITSASLDIPLVFAGKGVRRTDAEEAGADEVVLYPAYLRDVITVGRLLRGVPRAKRAHLVGSLAETTGMFTLVRALAALGRSAVLTLVRGLRRGEIRFFHGEVTSAELALIHGQAALHQLLLWTEARFEFLHEDVVRRQQIPLSHDELFADAERFLEGVRDSSGSLSPSMVLEQDVVRIQSLGRQVPTEVHGVLRMFDGHRLLADILEDSPYRVFETLRVAQRAVEVGLLKVVETQRPRAKWRAVLSIEEWLTGQDRDAAVERATSLIDSAPVSGTADTGQVEKTRESKPKFKKGKKRRTKQSSPPTPAEPPPAAARTSKPNIDWGALVPRIVGGEVGSLSQVVPAAQRSGEISLPRREEPREKLEALMDTGARERIFPKDAEPSIVVEPEPVIETVEPKTDQTNARPTEAIGTNGQAPDVVAPGLDPTEVADLVAAADAVNAKAAADDARAKADADAKAEADAKANAKAKAKADADAKAAIDAKRLEEAKAIAVPPPRSSSPSIDPAAARTKSPSAPPPIAIPAPRTSSPTIDPAIARAKSPSAPPPITSVPVIPRTKTSTAGTASTESSATDRATASDGSIAPAPLTSIAASDEGPTFLRTPPSTMLDRKFDDSDADTRGPDARASSPASARTKTPSVPPPVPTVPRTKTPSASPPVPAMTAEELRAKREAEQDAEDARLRAEAVELAKKQAAARAAEQEKQAQEAMELAQRLADARAKAQPPLTPVTPDPDSVPITLATPDPDRSMPITLATPDPDTEESLWKQAQARARAAAAGQETLPVPKLEAEDLIRELVGEKVTIAETPTSSVVVQEAMTIDRSIQTARIASAQITTVTEAPVAAVDQSAATELFGKGELAAPTEIDDEPSDGIVRHIPTVETKPQKRPPPPKVDVPDDRPGDRTGEITASRKKHASKPPENVEPSILIEDAAATTAAEVAAAHEAVAAAAIAQVPAPKTGDATGTHADQAVAEVRNDAAIAFSDAEEAFFRQGSEKETATTFQMTGPVETFDDLDDDYKPVGFWDRLRGKKPPK